MEATTKKGVLTFAVLATVIMTITNPSKQAYVEHVVWKFKDVTCQHKQLSATMQVSCVTLATLPPGTTVRMLDEFSRRQNFLLFSIYTTDFYGVQDRSIGLGSFFF